MPKFIYAERSVTKGVTRRSEFTGDPITPSDSVDIPGGPAHGIHVTGAGNVSVNPATGGTAVLTGLTAGQMAMVDIKRVNATGTTATGISVLYRAGLAV